MANIAIIETCNYSCKYCFAEEFTECGDNKIMSLENFKRVVDFVTQTQNSIGMIGGEPTLHPQFGEMLDYLISNGNVEDITVFTNGSNLMKYIRRLANSKVGLLVNYNSPAELTRQLRGNIEEGKKRFEHARNQIIEFNRLCPDKLTIGVNIFDNSTEWNHLVDIIKTLNNKHKVVRVSTVAPNINSDKRLNLTYYESMAESLLTMMESVQDIADEITFDCSKIPVCVMDKHKQRFEGIIKHIENRGGCVDYYKGFKCNPVLDITTDLNVIRCFSMSRINKVNLFDFKNMIDIYDYFRNEVDGICYNIKTNFMCETCKLGKQKLCNGGCLSFTTDKALIVKSFIDNVNRN